MKYTKKLPSTDIELRTQLLKDGWKQIWEPQSLALATLLSFPFALLLSGITLWYAYLFDHNLFSFISSGSLQIHFNINLKLLLFIIAIFAYMLLHELLHAAFIPNFAKSQKTFWGLNGLFGFVFTAEPMKKFRFIVISVMPFILLSLAPLHLLWALGLLNWYTVGLCVINAAGSCVDFLNAVLIAFQVKWGHTIINNGFETYHKLIK